MNYKAEYERWLISDALTDDEKAELKSIEADENEIRERFFAPIEFGTAGLRGIMGMGLRRMNRFVVRQATRAMAGIILERGGDAAERGVVVCYDCRINSRAFAVDASCVLAACGVHVRLFEQLRPTPELSFAIRRYGAAAGINITASHNPKEYNGYKAYWEDGAQLPPEKAALVADAMKGIDVIGEIPMADYDDAVRSGIIELIGAQIDEQFLEKVMEQTLRPGVIRRADISVVYTPFYGAGAKLIPVVLQRQGLKRLHLVAEQMEPDGSFPTTKNPNPEAEVGFERAVELARRTNADIIVGSDPDADRMGVMCRNGAGGYRLLTGNQVGALFLDYLISAKKENGTLPDNALVLKSIVSSEMARAVAEGHGVTMEETFTGFKYIAERMKKYENGEKSVLFGFEEAIGYAFGDFVRDKDAVTASMMVTEMASYYALSGCSLADHLEELYKKFGRYEEKNVSIVMPGIDGSAKMKALMDSMRAEPPAEIGGLRVVRVRDYLVGEAVSENGTEKLELSGENVLYFELDGDSSFIVRPSGTEPKMKIYIMAHGGDKKQCDYVAAALEEYAMSLKDRTTV